MTLTIRFAGLQDVLAVRSGTGLEIEVLNRNTALASCSLYLDRRFQRGKRDILIRGIGGYAILASAEDGQHSVVTADGRASGARLAFIAGMRRVAEVWTASALQQIAAGRRHIAQLGRRPGEQCLRQHRVIALDNRMVRYGRVARQRADHESAVRSGLYLPEGKSVDVNHLIRSLDIELHEIDQSCPPRDEPNIRELLGCFRPGSGLHGLVDGGRLLVLEGLHPILLRTANELQLVWTQV